MRRQEATALEPPLGMYSRVCGVLSKVTGLPSMGGAGGGEDYKKEEATLGYKNAGLRLGDDQRPLNGLKFKSLPSNIVFPPEGFHQTMSLLEFKTTPL